MRRLFYGRRPAAVRFQLGFFTLDLAAVAYFLATTFVRDALWLREADLLLGALLACEFLGRMLAHRDHMRRLDDGASWRYLDNGVAVIDLLVIASLLVPALGAKLGFLRVLRAVRLLRSYSLLGHLGTLSPAVGRNEEVIRAALALPVFVLIASSLVYVTQRGANERIADFVDALYFTVASLSTTGFGDVTLIGSTFGELLSVAMMIAGITLFLRLSQAAFRPRGEVRHP